MAMKVFQPEEMLTADDVNVYLVNTLGAYKTAGQSVVNSTTLVNDNHLFVTVAGNSVYALEGALKYTSLSATPGLKFQFTGPSGASLSWSTIGIQPGASSQSELTTNPLSISSAASAGSLASATEFVTFRGILRTATAGGTFRLMFAQFVSHANQILLLDDSYFVLRRFS